MLKKILIKLLVLMMRALPFFGNKHSIAETQLDRSLPKNIIYDSTGTANPSIASESISLRRKQKNARMQDIRAFW